MLSEKVVLERAFRAIDELVKKQASEGVPLARETPPKPEANPVAQPSLKGRAVELWRDGERFFIVADEQDELEAMRRFGARRGEVWTPVEIELGARFEDQAVRNEIAAFKRQFDGCLSLDAAGEGVPPEEWKARMLNRLFQDQGKTGQPGRITAATVRHGERKGGSDDW